VSAVGSRLGPEALVVVGAGHYWSFPLQYMQLTAGAELQISPAYGAIGQGLPQAIGAAVGRPDRTVVLFEGDASMMNHLAELDTAARHGVRLLAVVMNDGALGAEFHQLRVKDLDGRLAVLPTPDFSAVARAMGAWAGRMATSMAGVELGLDEFAGSTGPYILDARLSRTVVSDLYRVEHFGAHRAAPHQVRTRVAT
jgi:thiamine pyrophosphate-dependent acetolactate synthase large subunit-like protein